MDALMLLTDDHRRVRALLGAIENANDAWKKRLFDQVDSELQAHERIERTVFYPVMERYEPLQPMVREALEDHERFRCLLSDLAALPAIHPEFETKIQLLKSHVEQHIAGEENEMFPQVRDVVDASTIETVAAQIQEAKNSRS